MKQKYFLLTLACFLIFTNSANSQMVGTVGSALNNIFLPGHWLEVGEANIGAFGTNYWSNTNPPPAGYHSSLGFFGGSGGIGSVYDYGYNGWTTGTPPLYGDYTLAGIPYEGWGIQVGSATGLNWAFIENSNPAGTAAAITGPGSLTGGNVSYANTGGQLIANWAGSTSGGNLTIHMQSRIDTNASQIVVTVLFANIGTTALNNIYYLRTCDPDNESIVAGNPSTNNTVVYQNDADHRVLVSAVGQEYGAYLGLGTKDCRAKAFIYENWDGSFPEGIDGYVNDLSTVYTGTAPIVPTYTAGGTDNGDYAIGLIYNMGTIGAGDTAQIIYTYIYNGNSGLDSALSDVVTNPLLVVNDSALPTAPLPAATYDTFNSCEYGGLTIVPIDISNGNTGSWSYSTWTWSPATGLASTTGVNNSVNLSALPAIITYTITGTGTSSCDAETFYLTIKACNSVISNSPCVGDSLLLIDRGDSLGATYSWTGPNGFTSTRQNPFIYPASIANAGEYYITKTIGALDSLDSVAVIIHYQPVATATSNAPLCAGLVDTLRLFAAPDSTGETFSWTGPNSFSSGVQDPTLPGFTFADSGRYQVITTSSYGCKDTAYTHVGLVPPPPAPVISGPSPVCQSTAPVPFTVSGLVTGASIVWYPSGTSTASLSATPIVNTSVPGTTTYWASQIVGSCESPRDSISIKVITTPPAPTATGTLVYCQYVGPFDTLTVNDLPGATALWYTAATGGTGSTSEPIVNLSNYGPSTFYISQVDSGCEGPRAPVTINVNQQPSLPVVTPPIYCQDLLTPSPLSAIGSALIWYGPGLAPSGSSLAPTPVTTIAGADTFYVTQSITTLSKTCTSDSAMDIVTILPKPTPPVTTNVSYCQFAPSLPLTATGAALQWYYLGALIDSIPVPPTNIADTTTWYVTQSITSLGVTCQSDSTPLVVGVVYLPQFVITPSSPYVCQYDSINLMITQPPNVTLQFPGYTWVLPAGAHVVDGTYTTEMPSIVVQFDSANQANYVYLTASDDSGKCSTTDSLRIRVVAEPFAHSYTNPNVCLGDTTALSLSSQASDAVNFVWQIVNDNYLDASNEVNIIAASSNSGGPFSISWTDTGEHIIQVNTSTIEGCQSKPSFDTVKVSALPDADFTYKTTNESLCIEDTLLFTAQVDNPAYSYVWAPAHAFNNTNSPASWGKIEQAETVISLTVTNAFGCAAISEMTLSPGTCCTVSFPNAFTPNDDGRNDLFRPIFPDSSYHNFHVFTIANRWGQTIFESTNSRAAWDGKYNGIPQDMGIYYYYIKFDCGGNTVEQSGDVTLIR